jgi:S-adenosylmethionine hydrolase
VDAFDIGEAAYLLEQSTRYFPARMIFVAVVDPGVGTSRRPVLIRTQADKCYVGPDNGLFTHVVERETLAEAYVLSESRYFRRPEVSATFHGRDIFGPVAAHLALGVPPDCFGPSLTDLVLLPSARAQVVGKTVQGEIRHIDRFGNVVTNITPAVLAEIRPGQRLRITMAGNERLVSFHKTYGDAAPGELICLINSDEAFEIALPRGKAAACLTVQVGDRVVFET